MTGLALIAVAVIGAVLGLTFGLIALVEVMAQSGAIKRAIVRVLGGHR